MSRCATISVRGPFPRTVFASTSEWSIHSRFLQFTPNKIAHSILCFFQCNGAFHATTASTGKRRKFKYTRNLRLIRASRSGIERRVCNLCKHSRLFSTGFSRRYDGSFQLLQAIRSCRQNAQRRRSRNPSLFLEVPGLALLRRLSTKCKLYVFEKSAFDPEQTLWVTVISWGEEPYGDSSSGEGIRRPA